MAQRDAFFRMYGLELVIIFSTSRQLTVSNSEKMFASTITKFGIQKTYHGQIGLLLKPTGDADTARSLKIRDFSDTR